MKLPIIDADGHVMEPFDLWDERLPEEYRDRAWKRVKTAEGEQVSFLGNATGFEWTVGSLCTPGALSANGRLDRDLDTEVDLGVSDPARRVELMDEQGVAVSVLFPTMTLGLDDIPDAGFRAADARAYNSWIADFCGHDPIRLRYAAVLPLVDVDWALAEIERASTTVPPPSCSRRSPRLTAATSGAPTSIRSGTRSSTPGSRRWFTRRTRRAPRSGCATSGATAVQWQMGVPFQLQLAVMHVIDGRVLERHPDLPRRVSSKATSAGCRTGSGGSTRRTTRWRWWRRRPRVARSSSSAPNA